MGLKFFETSSRAEEACPPFHTFYYPLPSVTGHGPSNAGLINDIRVQRVNDSILQALLMISGVTRLKLPKSTHVTLSVGLTSRSRPTWVICVLLPEWRSDREVVLGSRHIGHRVSHAHGALHGALGLEIAGRSPRWQT